MKHLHDQVFVTKHGSNTQRALPVNFWSYELFCTGFAHPKYSCQSPYPTFSKRDLVSDLKMHRYLQRRLKVSQSLFYKSATFQVRLYITVFRCSALEPLDLFAQICNQYPQLIIPHLEAFVLCNNFVLRSFWLLLTGILTIF